MIQRPNPGIWSLVKSIGVIKGAPLGQSEPSLVIAIITCHNIAVGGKFLLVASVYNASSRRVKSKKCDLTVHKGRLKQNHC
eukprot:scaffold222129_cov57-Attheya_sp.AAC.1